MRRLQPLGKDVFPFPPQRRYEDIFGCSLKAMFVKENFTSRSHCHIRSQTRYYRRAFFQYSQGGGVRPKQTSFRFPGCFSKYMKVRFPDILHSVNFHRQNASVSILLYAGSLSGIMVLRSSALQPRPGPWVERPSATTSGTPGLMPRRVLAVAR